jgi:survival-of-motor-neuron-related-splicing factor 30
MSDLAALEDELAQAQEFVATCKEALDLDPDDQDVKTDMLSFQQQIPVLKAQIAALKAKSAPSRDVAGEAGGKSDAPKYDMSKHPKYQTTPELPPPPPPPPAEENRAFFNVGDVVQAKYSADKSWYPATIVSKTGSSSDPVYTVNFKGYDEKEQKRKHEVRPVENKKRKADSEPGASSSGAKKAAVIPPPPTSAPVHDGTVISGAPAIDASLVKKYEPSKVSDGPTRMAPAPKKLKANKTLEKSKSSWNDWQKSGPKKPAVGGATKLKKDSQFRTPDLPNAKGEFAVLAPYPAC